MAAAVSTYTVRPGDNLWSIAAANNTTVAAIKKNNASARGAYIHPGQVLTLGERVVPVPRDLPVGLRRPTDEGAAAITVPLPRRRPDRTEDAVAVQPGADTQIPVADTQTPIADTQTPVADTQTPIADTRTQPRTTEDATPTTPVVPFSRTNDAQVKGLQRDLRLLGYYNRSVDGDYGPGTRAAIAEYQRANNLPAGDPDGALVAQIHDAAARLPTTPQTTSAGARQPISPERMLEYRRLGAAIQERYPNTDLWRGIVPPSSAYDPLIRMVSQDTGVSEDTLRDLIFAESKGDWRAVSSADARGLTQVRSPAWTDVQRRYAWMPNYQYNVNNPALNLLAGAYYWQMNGGTSAGYVRGKQSEINDHARMMAGAPRSWNENMT